MDLEEKRRALEQARRARLAELGVATVAAKASELKPIAEGAAECFRIMQWNILADSMSDDGFLVHEVLQDWPAGKGNVRTSSGEVVKFTKLLDDMMVAKGDNEALEQLKRRYDTAEALTNMLATVDWQVRRLQIQLQVLAAGRPDVLVFQECDHYGHLVEDLAKLGYASSLPSAEKAYEPAHLIGYNNRTPEGAEEFQKAIERKGYAFLPNVGSTSMSLCLNRKAHREKVVDAAKKLGIDNKVVDERGRVDKKGFVGLSTAQLLSEAHLDPSEIDDDGVAIFWRVDRFAAAALQVRAFPGGQGGALLVRLQERSCAARELTIIGVHLSSGDDLKSEGKRLAEQVDVIGGLRELVEEAKRAGETVVLSLDANSHPQIGVDSGSSCWCSLHGALGASVWDTHFDSTGKLLTNGSLDPPVTSNKLRGPLSGQAKKIGLHSYYCIDHIFFIPTELSLRGHAITPKQFQSDGAAREVLNPSLSNPSDHYPVVADLEWAHKGSVKQMKIASGKPASMYLRAAADMLRGNEENEPALELYISALGGAINTASEVANHLQRDGLGTIERIYTDLPGIPTAKLGRSSQRPRLSILIRNVSADQKTGVV